MITIDISGWLIRDKGRRYLATPGGWYQLEGEALGGSGTERPVRVRGRVEGRRLDVQDCVPLTSPPIDQAADRPWLVRRGLPDHALASRLRLEAERWLEDAGYPYLSMPALWSRTEEYGAEELGVTFRGGDVLGLKLLQSPELPLFVALSEGVSSMRTFGRCFRHEAAHDPSRADTYLMEFEQLILARTGTDLDEMRQVTEDLVCHLARTAGMELDRSTFASVDMRRALRTDPEVDLLEFTVPPAWPRRAVEVLLTRLRSMGCTWYSLGDLDAVGDDVAPGDRLLVATTFRQASAVQRILDVAASHGGDPGPGADLASTLARTWNPTWYAYPPLRWREGEQDDSELTVRSFTSARDIADDETYTFDTELHLGGVEVAHVRQYAGVEEMRAYAAEAGSRAELGYLDGIRGRLPGAVGAFIGWERLMSVIVGAQRISDVVVFGRDGQGGGAYGER